jgi:nucleoside-diphosphate-sugar epimerase
MPIPEEPQPVHIASHEDRRIMRRILRESGVPVISIEPVVFLDNLLEGWALPPIRDENRIVYCHPLDLDVTWICLHDVAQLMMAAMERPELAGRNFAVAGRETVQLPELTKKLSRAWGRDLDYRSQTIPEFCDTISRTMQGRGLDIDSIIKDMFKAYTYYTESPDRPFKIDMEPVLRELPVTLTPIEEWAKTHKPPGWS